MIASACAWAYAFQSFRVYKRLSLPHMQTQLSVPTPLATMRAKPRSSGSRPAMAVHDGPCTRHGTMGRTAAQRVWINWDALMVKNNYVDLLFLIILHASIQTTIHDKFWIRIHFHMICSTCRKLHAHLDFDTCVARWKIHSIKRSTHCVAPC